VHEDVVLDLLLDAGFEHPDVNKPMVVDGRVVPDFRWPQTVDRRGRWRRLARPADDPTGGDQGVSNQTLTFP
jgi:hypothetical protein